VKRLLCLLAILTLAACGTIPQPFKHEGVNSFAVPMAPGGVMVRQAEPTLAGRALAEALVKAFSEDEVPASARDTALPGAWRLETAVSRAGGLATLDFTLLSTDGETKATHTARLLAEDWDSADGAVMAKLANEIVRSVSAPLRDPGGAQAAAAPAQRAKLPSVTIAPLAGLPGDGNTALHTALKRALEANGMLVRAEGGDYLVSGRFNIVPLPGNQDGLEVSWAVKDPAGKELGQAGQQGALPKGRLARPWGALAGDIAMGGAQGVLQIIYADRVKQ
jgi:hypothetical protein